MPGPFVTHYMTIKRGTQVIAQHMPVQLSTVNVDLILNSGGAIPTDSYNLQTWMWTSPVIQRSDYFIDEATNTSYQVFGNVGVYLLNLQMRVTKYTEVTP